MKLDKERDSFTPFTSFTLVTPFTPFTLQKQEKVNDGKRMVNGPFTVIACQPCTFAGLGKRGKRSKQYNAQWHFKGILGKRPKMTPFTTRGLK